MSYSRTSKASGSGLGSSHSVGGTSGGISSNRGTTLSSTSVMAPSHKQLMLELNDSRKRQSKRDEAIRRKIENDMSKRRDKVPMRYLKKTGTSKKNNKGIPGSVSSLRPNEPILCKSSTSALEAARLMGAKRENCILVVDDNNRLIGIFTAKDLAYRVVASGQVAAFVNVEQIMTKNPLCMADDTPASEGLNVMVQKGFRHLPISDSDGSVTGVLDITKCYQEAMEKLERMYESSKKLYDAIDNVNQEIGISQQPFQVVKYFDNLKEVMDGPILESVLDESTLPVYCNPKSSVLEAAIMMKENKTTAVLVKDANSEEVTGIFTSKDVVLRVIAAGLDPKTCSVVRVMTPQPDCASKDSTIHESLRKMFNGHYLNLPVIDNNEIIGIVEVLKLTYATLKQLKAVKSTDENDMNPIWNRFWTTLDDVESTHSDPYSNTGSNSYSLPSNPNLQLTNSNSIPYSLVSPNMHTELVLRNNNNALITNDVTPGDSISCVNEDLDDASSVGNEFSRMHITDKDLFELSFGFKFKSPSGRVHRINLKPKDGIQKFRTLIVNKLQPNELKAIEYVSLGNSNNNNNDNNSGSYFEDVASIASTGEEFDSGFAISYQDDEGDLVAITTDQDLLDCVQISKKLKLTKANIFIHKPSDSIETILKKVALPPAVTNNSEHHQQSGISYNPGINSDDEFIPGVPNQLLLPGAIVSLAVSILVVFTFSRR